MINKPLNLFYEEPDPDRWFPFDRYLRKAVRRIIRGRPRTGGVMTVAINLMKGLDKIGIPYRFNDYRYIEQHPEEIACIIGKPQLLFKRQWQNPVIFGAGIYSHPVDCPDLLDKYPIVKQVLVPGNWMEKMFAPYYGDKVKAWPAGIDTQYWRPQESEKPFDFLIYDKIRWKHEFFETELITPITGILQKHNIRYHFIRYGSYTHTDLVEKLKQSKAVIFLCEHETQGAAYQQILATGTPILAWDRGGYWQDPFYYPHKAQYGPVSSVPYWDDRCGLKFTSAADFEKNALVFLSKLNSFKPRDYILENLTLEVCAKQYVDIHEEISRQLAK